MSPFHEFEAMIPAELKAEIEALKAGDRRRHRHGRRLPRQRLPRPTVVSTTAAPGPPAAGGVASARPIAMRLELHDITKQFPGVLANDRISISADRGKVLGLLGENGAGKTTLMNILSGLYRPDSGQIFIDGDGAGLRRSGGGDRRRGRHGPPALHARARLRRGRGGGAWGGDASPTALGTFDRGAARKRIVELSEQYKLDVDPDATDRGPAGRRSPAGRDPQGAVPTERHPRPRRTQRGAHAVRDGGALRDHPLTRRSGTTVIFITHKLNEVLEVADDIDRAAPRHASPASADPKTTIARAARQPDGRTRRRARWSEGPATPGEVVLQPARTSRPRRPPPDGGQRHRPRRPGRRDRRRRGCPGQRPDGTGRGDRRACARSTPARRPSAARHIDRSSPRQVSDLGVAHIPEDRGRDGLDRHDDRRRELHPRHLPPAALQPARGPDRDGDPERARANGVKDFDIRTPSIDTMPGSLSGGNQQKVVVAREFSVPVKLVSRPSRRAASTSARSSTSTGASSSSAMPGRRS